MVAVAELVIRLTPGAVAERRDRGPGPLRQAGPRGRHPRAPAGALRGRGPAGPRRRGGGRWWSGSRWRPGARGRPVPARARPSTDALPVLVGLLTWLTVHSALTDALCREQRRPELESRERRVFLIVAGVVAVASVGDRRGGPLRRSGSAPRRGEPTAAAHPGRHPSRGAARDLARTGGDRALADPQRGLLPDRHRDRAAGDRARGVVAADPRPRRPRDHPQLLRPGRAGDDRVVDHPQLREQRGRR